MANYIPDGTTDFTGGQNSAVKPYAIGPNQYYTGINTSTEDGPLKPRWGIEEQTLDWTNAGNYTQVNGAQISYEEVFLRGNFQAFTSYTIGPDKYVIYVVTGFLFLINKTTFEVTVMNKANRLNARASRINWSNAGIYLVFYDFPNAPLILDGVTARRSNPSANEIPVSVLGAYNQNRLCIANAGIAWTAGDPAGSPAAPDAPITFLEVEQAGSPYVGDIYELPTANRNNDVITAMGFLQVLDKSTEIGPLLVASDKAIYSYRTDLPRSQWQGGANGYVFGSVLLYSAGIAAQRAYTNVNSDILFQSSDFQIRALSMARNSQKLWGNSPISREVQKFLDSHDTELSKFCTSSYFKNKVLFTCNPYRVDAYTAEGALVTDYVNAGVVVLEADNIATLTNPSVAPVWAGLWTGVGFMDFTSVDSDLFIAGKDGGRNKLYKFTPEKTYDYVNGEIRLIRSVIETKEYTCNDLTANKKLHHVDLGLEELEENVTVEVSYKPATMQQFFKWRDLEFCAPVEQCEGLPEFPNGLARQGIRDLNIGGVIEGECNPADGQLVHIFKRVQLRLIITGKYWELPYIKLQALAIPESQVNVYCEQVRNTKIPAQCFDPWYIPPTSNC